MYIAMNRFTVPDADRAAFEDMWLNRDSYLKQEPGFVEFHMLKGPEDDGATLYVSHTVWESAEAFKDWTRSDSFRAAHANAGSQRSLYTGHPKFEGFEAIQHITITNG